MSETADPIDAGYVSVLVESLSRPGSCTLSLHSFWAAIVLVEFEGP